MREKWGSFNLAMFLRWSWRHATIRMNSITAEPKATREPESYTRRLKITALRCPNAGIAEIEVHTIES